MSRESVKLDITAFLSTNSDEQNHEHQRLYERLAQWVSGVVNDPEFEPIDPFIQGTGMYWLSD